MNYPPENLLSRTPATEQILYNLFRSGGHWMPVAAQLYLRTGRYMPAEAKRWGLYAGFCDAFGRRRIGVDADATHIGWTAAPHPLQLPVPVRVTR